MVDVADIEKGAVEDGAEPLVRIPAEGVRVVNPGEQMAHLGQEHRGAGHGGVDVDPRGIRPRDPDDLGDGIHGARAGGPDGGDDDRGAPAGGDVGGHGGLEGVGPHRKGVRVDGDEAEVVAPESRQENGFGDRGVGLRGGVGDERLGHGLQAATLLRMRPRPLSRRQHRDQSPGRCGVLYGAPPALVQATQVAEPVGDDLLDLGEGRG